MPDQIEDQNVEELGSIDPTKEKEPIDVTKPLNEYKDKFTEVDEALDARLKALGQKEEEDFDKRLSEMDFTERYDNHLSGLPKLDFSTPNVSPDRLASDNDLFRDFVRDAADNLNDFGEVIDGKTGEVVPFDKTEYQKEMDSALGYRGMAYKKKISAGSEGEELASDLTLGYLDKFDDGSVYEYLIPSVNPLNGQAIMKKVTGTREEIARLGLNPMKKFGIQDDNNGYFESFFKGAANTLYGTDDVLVAASKFVTNPFNVFGATSEAGGFIAMGGYHSFGGFDSLNSVHEDILADTADNGYIASKASAEMGSWDWLGAGLGNVAASLVQFGGVGRGVRGVVSGAEAVTKSLGGEAFKKATVNTIAGWGGSGIVGFGYGYNEAKENGLSEFDAQLFGVVVGGINATIERTLGSQFDDYLTGGGTKSVSKALLKELDGKITPDNIKNVLQAKGKMFGDIADRIVVQSLPEGGEEVLQTIVEQAGRWATNAIKGSDVERGQGKFMNDSFNGEEIISAGLFGFMGAMPFNSFKGNKSIQHHIADGKKAELDAAMDKLYASKKLDLKQYINLKTKVENIDGILNGYNKELKALTGDDKKPLRDAFFELVDVRSSLIARRDSRLRELDLKDIGSVKEQGEEIRKEFTEIEEKLTDVDDRIKKFTSDEVISQNVAQLKKDKENFDESSNNAFSMLLDNDEKYRNEEEFQKAIDEEKIDLESDRSLFSNLNQFRVVMDYVIANPNSETTTKIKEKLKKDNTAFLGQSSFLYATGNVDEKKALLKEMGVDESLIPLTAEEKSARKAEGKNSFEQLMANEKELLNAEGGDANDFTAARAVLQNRKTNGLTDESIQAMDESESVASALGENGFAVAKLIGKSSSPVSLIPVQSKTKQSEGLHDSVSGATVLTADFDRIAELQAIGSKATKAEAKELSELQADLLHKTVHELTHSELDRSLLNYHASWKLSLQNNKLNPGAVIFERLKRLALVSGAVLTKSGYKGYFTEIYADHVGMTPDEQVDNNLKLVREFYAELRSNKDFQAQLDSVDLNSKKHAGLLKMLGYDYKPLDGKRTLLQEAIAMLTSIIDKLGSFLNRAERTALKEAFILGANLQYAPMIRKGIAGKGTQLPNHTTDHSIAAFQIKNMFPGMEDISIDDLALNVMIEVEEKIDPNMSTEKLNTLGNKVQGIANTIKKEQIKGSLRVIYFESTDAIAFFYKVKEGDGESQRRKFINKYGDTINVNTDVENKTSAVTLSKNVGFDAFLPENSTNPEFMAQRELLNNWDRANKEKFVGKAELRYDSEHEWNLKGKDLRGQVSVVYTYKDGSQAVIGYTHDLTKIRLAVMLDGKAKITVRVKATGYGSLALVKRNENGQIISVINIKENKNDTADFKGYTQERVFHRTDFNYDTVENLSEKTNAKADNADMITPDKASLKPIFSKKMFETGYEGFDPFWRPEEETVEADISNYENRDHSKSREEDIQFQKDLALKAIRRIMLFDDLNFEFYSEIYNGLLKKGSKYLADTYGDQYRMFGAATVEEAQALRKAMYDEFIKSFDEVTGDQFFDRQDGQDFEGFGHNPSLTISKAIRTDLETINYTYDGKRKFVGFSRAKDVMFSASENTGGFDQMVEKLRTMIDDKFYGESNEVARAIYARLTSIKDPVPADVRNSYWSQFASYVQKDALTFSPNEDGTAKLFYSGSSSKVRQKATTAQQEMVAQYTKLEALVRSFGLEGTTDADIKLIKQRIADELFNNVGPEYRYPNSSKVSLVNTVGFSTKDLTGANWKALMGFKLTTGQFFANRESQKKNATDKDKIKDLFLSDAEWKAKTDMVVEFFKAFGVVFPSDFFSRTSPVLQDIQTKFKEFREMGMSEQDAIKEARAFYKDRDFFEFRTTWGETKAKSNEHMPIAYQAFNLANLITLDLQMIASKKKLPLAKQGTPLANHKEIGVLMSEIAKFESNFRSPEHYFDVNFNKRWGRSIKSYSDEIFSQLANPQSGLLAMYRNSPIYKDNPILDQIEKLGDMPIAAEIAGIKSFNDYQKNTTAENAADLDFMFMQLAAFASGNEDNISNSYHHIEDINSDKPRISAYKLRRILESQYDTQIKKIIATEQRRYEIAQARFDNAFLEGPIDGKEQLYYVTDESAFNDLVSSNKLFYEYVRSDKPDKDGKPGMAYYKKGQIFNRENYFYKGKSADQIAKEIKKETDRSFQEWLDKGLNIPLPANEMSALTQRESSMKVGEDKAKDTAEKIDQAKKKLQREVFENWRMNSIINRYWLSQIQMGDYIYYKSGDNGVDLSKRRAGSDAPFYRGDFGQEKIRLVSLEDFEGGKSNLSLPKMVFNEDEKVWEYSDSKTEDTQIESNQTDAQGFITEQFAETLKKAYGRFGGYDKIFKPVMFGVGKDHIDTGQPMYLKLSLAVLPNPHSDTDFYNKYPNMRAMAFKIYGEDSSTGPITDIAVFGSGIKVGTNAINKLDAPSYLVSEFDSNLFGIQNNAFHETEGDHYMDGGLVQMTKILGDNGNSEAMQAYHEMEAGILSKETLRFLNEDAMYVDQIRKLVLEQLSDEDHNLPLKAVLENDKLNPFNHPITAKHVENVLNSMIKKRMDLASKPVDKLVNMSNYGLGRPALSESEVADRESIIELLGFTPEEYNSELKWAGIRTVNDLSIYDLKDLLKEGEVKVDNFGHILRPDGSVRIFPAEVLVPGDNYAIGDMTIGVRIPTSKLSSIIPIRVVGTLDKTQGNVIVTSKEGTGMLGFDFDIDGLFVWKKEVSNPSPQNFTVRRMFNIAFDILLDPKNYNQLTSPTVMDTLKSKVKEYANPEAQEESNLFSSENTAVERNGVNEVFESNPELSQIGTAEEYSHFSPERQLQLKKLNSVGAKMIGISANASGIHSMLVQIGAKLNPTKLDSRSYLLEDGSLSYGYVNKSSDGQFVSDIFSELINGATDNAKEQLLGKLNINLFTAGVLTDMISHGMPLGYALDFINQPIIKEWVATEEFQNTAVFNGVPDDIFNTLLEKYEQKIGGGYTYYNRSKIADDPGNVIYKQVIDAEAKTAGSRSLIYKEDRFFISQESLSSNLNAKNNESHYKTQLQVLEKFKYYKSLSSITGDAGKLIGLTSSYPKTFIELINVDKKINETFFSINAPKMSFVEMNPVLMEHVSTIKRLIDNYSRKKMYANPKISANHLQQFASLPIDLQKRIENDFNIYLHTFAPSNSESVFNLRTSNFNGKLISPFLYVHQSARVIADMKEKFPNNKFLALLEVKKETGSYADILNGKGDPAHVTSDLTFDPDESMLQEIYDDFYALPDVFEHTYTAEIDLVEKSVPLNVSPAEILLGQLLYTKGFSFGGFSYSKILPPGVMEILASQMDQVSDELFNEEADPEIFMNFLTEFNTQVKINNPKAITTLKDSQIEIFKRSGINSFIADSKGETFGNMKIVTRAGKQMIILNRRSLDADYNNALSNVIRGGVFNIREGKNTRIFSLDVISDSKVYFKEVRPFESTKVKSYMPNTIGILKEGVEQEVEEEEFIAGLYNGVPMSEKNQILLGNIDRTHKPDFFDLSEKAIASGKRTALSVYPQSLQVLTNGSLVKLQTGETISLVKIIKDPIDVVKSFNNWKVRGNDPNIFIEEWARVNGVKGEDFTDITSEFPFTVRFEHIATTDQIGNVIRWSEKYNPQNEQKSDISEYNASNIRKQKDSVKEKAKGLSRRSLYMVSNPSKFFDSLTEFSRTEKALLKEFIDDQGYITASGDQISADITDSDISYYEVKSTFMSPDTTIEEKKMKVAQSLLGDSVFEDVWPNWETKKDEIVSEGLTNWSTGEPMTYEEYIERELDRFLEEEEEVLRIQSALDNGLLDTPAMIVKHARDLETNFGSAKGLIKKEYGKLFRTLATMTGEVFEQLQMDAILKEFPEYEFPEQKDLSLGMAGVRTKSLVDFGTEQVVMQFLAKRISEVGLSADTEKKNTRSVLNSAMKAVVDAHNNAHPQSFLDKVQLWKRSSYYREALDWLFEKDDEGNYSGEMMARYQADQKEIHDRIFHKIDSEQFDFKVYAIPVWNIYNDLVRLIRKPLLTQVEIDTIQETGRRYNDFNNAPGFFDSMSDQEKREYSRDQGKLRRLLVKAEIVNSGDSDKYAEIKRHAEGNGSDSKLWKAKLALYDLIYNKGNKLMKDAGFDYYSIDKALMPHMRMGTFETLAQHGLGAAYKKFLSRDNDDVDPDPVLGPSVTKSYETSDDIPFRTISRKKEFSIDPLKIFTHHFDSLIFKKHYDKILPEMKSIDLYLSIKSKADPTKFKNLQAYIKTYADERLFLQKDDFSRSPIGKIIDFMSTAVVFNFLAFAPVTSSLNALVGLNEDYKKLTSEYGFREGSAKFALGVKRLIGPTKGSFLAGIKNGNWAFSEKATALMDYYNIQTYSDDLRQASSVFGDVQEFGMSLQRGSEVLVRGIVFFSELSEEQWQNFTVEDGKVIIKDESLKPTKTEVAKWESDLGEIHGKYENSTKRLYNGNSIIRAAFLFKGWMIDYMLLRFRSKTVDMFGREKEGYYRTGIRMIIDHKNSLQSMRAGNLSKLETQNLRKIAYDLVLVSALGLSNIPDDDDPIMRAYQAYIKRLLGQLYYQFDLSGMVETIKSPFPQVHILERLATATESMFQLEFEKSGKAIVALVPGKQIVSGAMSLAE